MVDTFNQELVLKFTREVEYRLEEIMADNQGSATFAREARIVFHHHDNSTTISGTVHGSNIATGSAQINSSPVQFNSASDIAAEINALKSLTAEFSKANQKTLATALDFLAAAAEDDSASVEEVKNAAQTAAELRVRSKIIWDFGGSATGPYARHEEGASPFPQGGITEE